MKKDIYYNVYYGKLYENIEHGKLETFEVVLSMEKLNIFLLKEKLK